ncbi:MAG TPA: choice-of-anchor J domain-containing protein [Flavobacteriaceae bacterium]|nr:choice-of-anchor J domain-containing protein [Flavobacteriaceae bacterium]
MKKITFLMAFFACIAMNAQQTTIFEDDFESYENFSIEDLGDWTLVDVDGLPTYGFSGITFQNSGSPMAFIVFNSTATMPPLTPSEGSDWTARSGEKCMTSFAANPGPNDDWLISPQITLGESDNIVSFWAKAADGSYNNEKFNVAISVTDTDPANFTMLETDLVPSAMEWEEFVVELEEEYAEQDVYIAINHVANDQFGFQIDDFKVTTGALSVDHVNFEGFTHYISDNFLHLSSNQAMNNVRIYNILGQEVVNQKLANNKESIDISNLQSGIYITKIDIDGVTKSFKITKR